MNVRSIGARAAVTDVLGAAGLVALVGVFAAVAFSHLDGLKWDSDEGINVCLAWLVHDGYPLYARVWSDHAPGLIVAVAWAFRLAGVSLAAARGLTVLFAIAGLLGAAGCAREIALGQGGGRGAGWLAAWAAAAALAVAPNFWWASRAAMIDIPMLSAAAVAMAAGFAFGRTRRRAWLAAAAAAYGLSLWIKYHMVYLAPLLAALVVATRRAEAPGRRVRATVGDLALGAGLAALPLAASFAVFDGRAMYDQSVASFFTTLSRYPVDATANLATAWTWLTADNAGLAALAFAGIAAIIARPERAGVVTLAWAGMTVATAARYAPLYIKVHFEPLLFVLAILAGAGVGAAAAHASSGAAGTGPSGHARWGGRRASRAVLAVATVGTAAYLADLLHVLAVDRSLVRARGYDNTGEAVLPGSDGWDKEARREERLQAGADFLRAHSGPDDFVVTDHQIIAFLAGRRMPPEMAVINSRAVGIGLLTPARLIDLTERYRVPAVLVWDEDVITAEYLDWVQARFALAADLGSDRYGFAR